MDFSDYPEAALERDAIHNFNWLNHDDENFWHTGGSTLKVHISIWEKFDLLPTPPRSPNHSGEESPELNKFVKDCESIFGNSYSDVDLDDIDFEEDCVFSATQPFLYSSTNNLKSAVAKKELKHDCMWSGQCGEDCTADSSKSRHCYSYKSQFKRRTDSVSSEFSDSSQYTFSDNSQRPITPVSSLSGLSLSLLPGASSINNYLNENTSNVCGTTESMIALSDHSYSSCHQIVRNPVTNHNHRLSYTLQSIIVDSSSDDEDEDEEDDNDNQNDTFLGIPTPSDSEEEIDVVGFDKQVTVPQRSKTISNIERILPTKPSPNQCKKIQFAVAMAAHGNSAKRKYGGGVTESPAAKRRFFENSTGKLVQQQKRQSMQSLQNKSVKRKIRVDSVSDSEGIEYNSSNNMIKDRSQHNTMERKRREDLRSWFSNLRDQVPELCDSTRASKVMILIKAREYIKSLNLMNSNMEKEKRQETKRNKELTERLRILKTKVAHKVN